MKPATALSAVAPDDGPAIARLRTGDVTALGELYDRHHVPVRTFAVRFLGDAAAAEDLVHDVFLNLGYVPTQGLEFLVLDEADRMFDMGFIDDIKRIIGFLPKERQTLMFSAPWPPRSAGWPKRYSTIRWRSPSR